MKPLKVDILRLFGPRIFKVELPKDIFDKLVKITDNLKVDEKAISEGCNLVGQIKQEINISQDILNKEGLYSFFVECLRTYVATCLNELRILDIKKHYVACDLTTMWFNEMQPGGEYNPVHQHTGCHVSSTLYLKIPKNRPKRNIECKDDRDGVIEFIDRSVYPESLYSGSQAIQPKEGIMYMWPSDILHTVYPFLGDEVRRSVAWNGTYRLMNKENNQCVLGAHTWPKELNQIK